MIAWIVRHFVLASRPVVIEGLAIVLCKHKVGLFFFIRKLKLPIIFLPLNLQNITNFLLDNGEIEMTLLFKVT